MATQSDHPVRDSFLRLLLLLVWYGAVFFVGLMAVGFLLVFAGSLGERLAAALGGSLLAKVAGFIVAFVVLVAIEGGVGAAIGFAYAAFEQRWPDNPVERLVKWVKDDAA
jgi:purine-cytosine permease-like protein